MTPLTITSITVLRLLLLLLLLMMMMIMIIIIIIIIIMILSHSNYSVLASHTVQVCRSHISQTELETTAAPRRHCSTGRIFSHDTLFPQSKILPHHLLHTLLPEQTNHPYHLRSRTHSFKLSSQHDERNFIDRMLFKNANPVCTQ